MKQWLTLKEIEESFGLRQDYLKFLIYNRKLPAMKRRTPGAPVVVREDWLERLLQAVDNLQELSITATALSQLPVPRHRAGRGGERLSLLYVEDFPDEAKLDEALEQMSFVVTVDLLTGRDVDKLYAESQRREVMSR